MQDRFFNHPFESSLTDLSMAILNKKKMFGGVQTIVTCAGKISHNELIFQNV